MSLQCGLYDVSVADVFTTAQRSAVMAAVCSRGNRATEGKLVDLLRSHGITGWRRHAALPGKPDFVFPRERLIVFVDGCFWHGCAKHGEIPKTNSVYWAHKIGLNKKRDRAINRRLRLAGWRVLRIWSHSLTAPKAVVARIISALSATNSRGNHTSRT